MVVVTVFKVLIDFTCKVIFLFAQDFESLHSHEWKRECQKVCGESSNLNLYPVLQLAFYNILKLFLGFKVSL